MRAVSFILLTYISISLVFCAKENESDSKKDQKTLCKEAVDSIQKDYFFKKEAKNFKYDSPEFQKVVKEAFALGENCKQIRSMTKAVGTLIKPFFKKRNRLESKKNTSVVGGIQKPSKQRDASITKRKMVKQQIKRRQMKAAAQDKRVADNEGSFLAKDDYETEVEIVMLIQFMRKEGDNLKELINGPGREEILKFLHRRISNIHDYYHENRASRVGLKDKKMDYGLVF